MALVQAVQTRPKILPMAEERRRFQRVRVNVLGRYLLPDRREYPCQVANMSPGGMALIVPVSGQEGERVIAYIDHLGRLEGKIARLYPNGFAMTAAETPPPRPPPPPKAGPPACHAQWRQAHLPHHRPVLVGRRDHDRSAARDRDAGQPRGRPAPRGAPPRRRLHGRVHAGAASRLPRRERLRTVNASPPFALKNAGPEGPARRSRARARAPRPPAKR